MVLSIRVTNDVARRVVQMLQNDVDNKMMSTNDYNMMLTNDTEKENTIMPCVEQQKKCARTKQTL